MQERILSVGSGAYSGFSYPVLLESLARCGITHVEPAFIQGYTDPFDEDVFSLHHAAQINRWLDDSGVGCYAFSAHMSLGRPDSVDIFRRRMDFARTLGARIINTTAAAKADEKAFFANIGTLAAYAEDIGLLIGLENPGDGGENIFNTARDGIELIREIDHPNVTMNYDPGNVPSHFSGKVDPVAEALTAIPHCAHMHIKDVRTLTDGWAYPGVSQGDIPYDAIMSELAAHPDLSFSLEILPAICRDLSSKPRRVTPPPTLEQIETTISHAVAYVRSHIPSMSKRKSEK